MPRRELFQRGAHFFQREDTRRSQKGSSQVSQAISITQSGNQDQTVAKTRRVGATPIFSPSVRLAR